MKLHTFYSTTFTFLMIWIVSLGEIATAFAADEAADGEPKEEFVCRADLFYSWKRKDMPDADGKKMIKFEPAEEFHSTVIGRHKDEELSKKQLAANLVAAQPVALKACAESHQNASGCTSIRIKALGGDVGLMDFAAKKAVLDAITEDCASITGECLKTRSGDPTCQKEAVVPDPSAAKAGEKEDPKKKKK